MQWSSFFPHFRFACEVRDAAVKHRSFRRSAGVAKPCLRRLEPSSHHVASKLSRLPSRPSPPTLHDNTSLPHPLPSPTQQHHHDTPIPHPRFYALRHITRRVEEAPALLLQRGADTVHHLLIISFEYPLAEHHRYTSRDWTAEAVRNISESVCGGDGEDQEGRGGAA